MSLVEQAIARMRNQARASAPKTAEAGSKAAASPPILDQPAHPAAEPHRRMTLDMEALRTHGYLPELGKDRQFADHYRRIKRPLIDKAMSGISGIGEPLVAIITSALPGDGKTFTSINLALSIALERDFSVLLIDCDVAKRHISEVLGLKEERGLLDVLADESVDIDSVVVQTNQRGLAILPAGRRAEGAAELLSSNRMRQIVADLSKRNPRRLLVLDSPPLLITNEGRSLVKIAGQVVLVVRAGHTPRQAVQDALGLVDPQQAGGIILNHVPMGQSEGYYGYGSYGAAGDAT
jgi:exopolysaccharide/PEP-CTERM locus tyrosine autokinase